MMNKIVECVPNFSEGKNQATIQAIAGAIQSVKTVKLLNVDPGEDFNRTVYTFVGPPDAVLEAAFEAARIGIALIDMQQHKGEHARMGALDVMPFIPIKNVTMQECITLSHQFGERMATELKIPVFLYANSAKKPERIRLPDIRKGEYEALEEKFHDPGFTPDFGEPIFIPKSGTTATGAREILIAYNVNLNTSDKSIASKISGNIRTSGVIKKDSHGKKIIGSEGKPVRIPGRFKGVQAGGMMYNEDITQVSMNLLNYHNVSLHHVYEAITQEANTLGVQVTGSEIVGLVPEEALLLAGKFYAKKQEKFLSTDEKQLIDFAIEKLGLNDLYTFNLGKKVIENIVAEKGPLISKTVEGFLSELASLSPAPGGGSVAALAGALGAALNSMVCQLTIGKEKYKQVEPEIKQILIQSEQLRQQLTNLIDLDTDAFADVIKAFKLPKDTETQKKQRSKAIQAGYKKATQVPFETAKRCEQLLDIAEEIAHNGNQNSITDAGVAALMAKAGVEAAIFNVRINLGSLKDEQFIEKIKNQLKSLSDKTAKKTQRVLDIVDNKI
jgi:glutamate formiminotransferase/formiminotetrahydrofolate cyclodeaminase